MLLELFRYSLYEAVHPIKLTAPNLANFVATVNSSQNVWSVV